MTARRLTAAGGLAAVLVAGTAAAAAPAAAAPTHAAPARTLHGVHVHVTSTHLVSAPHRTAPGITHLVNSGHAPVFAFAAEHAGTATLAADLKRADGKAGPGKLLRDFTLLDLVVPGAGDYVRLRRGTVYLVSAELAHPTAGKVSTLTVTGPARNAVRPPASRVVIDRGRALHATRLLPRRGYLDLINRSSRLVELLIINVGAKVSTATLRHFVNHPSFAGILDISPRFRSSFTGLMPANGRVAQKQDSPKGRSVLITLPLTRANLARLRLHASGVRGVLFG